MENLSDYNKNQFNNFDDEKNKKFEADYKLFDSQTASTFTEAIHQIKEDEYFVIRKIIVTNSTQAIVSLHLVEEQKNFIISHMAEILEKYGEHNFVIWYNKKNEFRFFLSKFCRNQFMRKSDKPSKFYKEHFVRDYGEQIEYFDTYIDKDTEENDDDEFHNVKIDEIYNWTIMQLNKLVKDKTITKGQCNYFIKYLDYVTHIHVNGTRISLKKASEHFKVPYSSFANTIIKIKRILQKKIK